MNHRMMLGVLLALLVCITGGLWLALEFGARSTGTKHDPDGLADDHRPRIVALSPAIAVTLRDLGLAHRVVGKHRWDVVLPDDVAVCGDQTGIDYEALLATNPTHVLTQWGTRDLPARLRELVRRYGWIVRDYRLLTLDDVATTASELAEEFGEWATPGAALPADPQEVLAICNASWSPREGIAEAGKVLLLASVDPPAAIGPGSFHHELFVRLGGQPAISSGRPYVPLEVESLLSMDVDAIVLLQPRGRGEPARIGAPMWDEVAKALGPLAYRPIAAVTAKRVVLVDHPLSLLPATSLMQVADELAEGLGSLAHRDEQRERRGGEPRGLGDIR